MQNMNPMELLKIKEDLEKFRAAHPKFIMFLNNVGPAAMKEGSVLDLSVTTPEGEKYDTNIKLNADDIALINTIMGMRR
jgi:hypothetical protein